MINDKDLDLPAKPMSGLLWVNRDGDKSIKGIQLSGQQLDQIIDIGSKNIPEIINIVKEITNIIRIKEQGKADVNRIESETRKAVAIAKSEIDRLRQVGDNIRTKGQVVSDIVRNVTEMLKTIPDIDSSSRMALIDSLSTILELAVKSD